MTRILSQRESIRQIKKKFQRHHNLRMKQPTTQTKQGTKHVLALPKASVLSANLQELDETVKAMMGQSENIIQTGKEQRRAKLCKVCGKEGHRTDIMRHIESCHLEGVSIPCSRCDKMLRSRHALRQHMKINHEEY